ncbi:unnamed protein product [Moneuplotes crassus]|uniref:Uncharacterized protein n=1 Tax=Euplotes crassus TaxID=5936 RepID=A0AAD1USS6_EUPCR|nr:unnamed protein product [Moneuplotes crassus]
MDICPILPENLTLTESLAKEMNDNTSMNEKMIRKVKNIKLKYLFENNRLKGSRKSIDVKIFSPQRRYEQPLYPNDNMFPEYSLKSFESVRHGESGMNRYGSGQRMIPRLSSNFTNNVEHTNYLQPHGEPNWCRKSEALLSAPNQEKDNSEDSRLCLNKTISN